MLKHVEWLTFSCVVCALCVVNLSVCVTLLTSYLAVGCIVYPKRGLFSICFVFHLSTGSHHLAAGLTLNQFTV